MHYLLLLLFFCFCSPLTGQDQEEQAIYWLQRAHTIHRYEAGQVDVVRGCYIERSRDLASASIEAMAIERSYCSAEGENQGWLFLPDLLESDPIRSGSHKTLSVSCNLIFDWNEKGQLSAMRAEEPATGEVLERWQLRRRSEGLEELVEVVDQQGRYVRYRLVEQAEKWMLVQVDRGEALQLQYRYLPSLDAAPPLMAKKERFVEQQLVEQLFNEYYGRGHFAAGRIARQTLVSLPTPALPRQVRYEYEPGITDVIEDRGYRYRYRYGTMGLVSSFELWQSTEEGEELLRKEQFTWQGRPHYGGFVVTEVEVAEKGREPFVLYYMYDEHGRVVSHRLEGALTRELVAEKESYGFHYQYGEGLEGALLEKRGDNGEFVRFCHDEEGRLIGQLWGEKEEAVGRLFWKKDALGRFLEVVVDDGQASSPSSLEGVHERHFVRYSWSGHQPLPTEQLIGSYEVAEGTMVEQIRGSIRFQPLQQGRGWIEERYDGRGELVSSVVHSQDGRGEQTSWQNSLGEVCQTAPGEMSFYRPEIGSGQQQYRRYFCDGEGRRNGCEVICRDGKRRMEKWHYDGWGELTAATDELGHLVCYERPKRSQWRVELPVVECGSELCSIDYSYELDSSGRLLALTDPHREQYRYTYNSRGDLVATRFPDGTQEVRSYYKDGSLRSLRKRDGSSVLWHRGSRANELVEEVVDRQGKGRFRQIHRQQLGRLIETITSSGDRLSWERHLGSIELKAERQGRAWRELQWKMDAASEQATSLTTRVNQQEWLEVALSNEEREALEQIDNRAARVRWEEVTNRWGQAVWLKREELEDGRQRLTRYDTLGRAVELRLLSREGDCFERQEMAYDGKLGKVSCQLFASEASEPFFQYEKQIDSMGRVCCLRQRLWGADWQEQSYAYAVNGLLCSIVKGDGIVLELEYDPLCRLKELRSNDGTVDYSYEYDEEGRLCQIDDLLQSRVTRRRWGPDGRLAEEQLTTGWKISYERDLQGRLVKSLLPDGSSILRQYEGCDLVSLSRLDCEGNLLYTHRYRAFDSAGRPLEAELAASLGTIRWQYGKKGVLEAIESSHWSQTRLEASEGGGEEDYGLSTQGLFLAGEQWYRSDERRRLRGERGLITASYSYDEAGNLASDQCVGHRDLNGNLVEWRVEGRHFMASYDALNRLQRLVIDGNQRIDYGWDGWGRRIQRELSRLEAGEWQSQEKVYYLFEEGSEIAICQPTGDLVALRLLGSSPIVGESAVALERANHLFVPIHDWRGSVAALLDGEQGKLVEQYQYSGYGCEQLYGGSTSPWRWAGQSTEEPSGLVCFGARFYLPQKGQWLSQDPMGMAEGPNPVIFAMNDPVHSVDWRGAMAFPLSWEEAYSCIEGACSDGVSFFSPFLLFNSRSGERGGLEVQMDRWIREQFPAAFLKLAGYHQQGSKVGVYGSGELCEKVRITSVNGILNNLEDMEEALHLLSSSHGTINVHYVFRPTRGWMKDLASGGIMRWLGCTSPYAYQLADTWRRLIDEMGGNEEGGLIVHYAHSLGGVDTYAAARLLTSQEQRMLRIVTFGSAQVIGHEEFESAANYVSRNDAVPWLVDTPGYLWALLSEGDHLIHDLGDSNGYPFLDHLWARGPYREMVRSLGEQFCHTWLRGYQKAKNVLAETMPSRP